MTARTARYDYRFPSLFSQLSGIDERWNSLTGERGYPGVNLYVNDDMLTVTAELPGVEANDLSLSIEEDILTLSFIRKKEETGEGVTVLRRERPHGKFTRNITLPFRVEHDKINANLKDGILTVLLPRAEADKPKKITVNG